ncbi:hypothetical protein ACHAXH_005451 [Discostella pseudostelligera]|jgi:hypothetical protein
MNIPDNEKEEAEVDDGEHAISSSSPAVHPSHHHITTMKAGPYLIITNISKRQNIRNLLQIAAAYGVPKVLVVGQKKFVFDLDEDDDNEVADDIDATDNNIDGTGNNRDDSEEKEDVVDDDNDDNDDEGNKNRRKGQSNNSKKTTDIPAMLQQGIRNGKLTIMKFDKLEECVAYIKGMPCCCDGCSGDEVYTGDEAEILMATSDVEQTMVHKNTPATTSKSPSASITRKNTIPIIGVEIDNSSVNLEEEPFPSYFSTTSCNCTSIALMMGNEGSGMSSKQMSICDGFIRISQYGGGTASLNVSVAAALVLHRYHHWRRGEDLKSIVRCSANDN